MIRIPGSRYRWSLSPQAGRRRVSTLIGAACVVSLVLASCGGDTPGPDSESADPEAEGDVVDVEWAHFWVGTNPAAPWGEVLVDEFNDRFAGQYRIVERVTPGDEEHRERMRADAAADALPDVLNGNIELMRDLTATGRLVDLAPYLEADSEWASSFVERTFEYYEQDDGAIYGIPFNRDYIGVYYNQALLDQAGVAGAPGDWDWEEFFAACEQLTAAGILPFAMDGEWVTLLMWANMVGTQPGGAEWLASQDTGRQFAGVEPVIAGTEMLRDYHNQGCVNEDAFTREYGTAATLFLQGEAAMIANGPWMINQITGEVAETAEGLAEDVAYSTSPGGGSIFIIGESAFAVGGKEPEKVQGAIEFIKFVTSAEQVANQLQILGTGTPVDVELPDGTPPHLVSIIEQGEQADLLYPHAFHALDTAVVREWVNQWPDFVRGGPTTEEFLSRLDDVQASL